MSKGCGVCVFVFAIQRTCDALLDLLSSHRCECVTVVLGRAVAGARQPLAPTTSRARVQPNEAAPQGSLGRANTENHKESGIRSSSKISKIQKFIETNLLKKSVKRSSVLPIFLSKRPILMGVPRDHGDRLQLVVWMVGLVFVLSVLPLVS
jgi:hypothetical protein